MTLGNPCRFFVVVLETGGPIAAPSPLQMDGALYMAQQYEYECSIVAECEW